MGVNLNIVLIKNRFQFVGRYNQFIYQNGEWHDSLIFEKIID
jgi:ribosomal-protein-alanine N-acetyltransferase